MLRCFLALALLALGAHADVRVVDSAGGGAYTQISAAVAAASDGDVILVKSGVYFAFTVNDKSLDIVADVGAAATIQGSVILSGIGVTRRVTLTAFTLRGPATLLSAPSPALIVSGNSGSIRVQGCTIEGFDRPLCDGPNAHGGAAVDISDSADVAFAGCALRGGDGAFRNGYAGSGGRGLGGTSSHVALYDCTVFGGEGGGETPNCPGYGYCCSYGGDGGDGIRWSGASTTFLSHCDVRGGTTGPLPVSGIAVPYGGCSGSGLFVTVFPASSVTARALESTFQRGGPSPGCLSPVADILLNAPSTFQTFTGSARRINATRVAREQQPARVEFFGQPGDQVRLVIGEATQHVFSPTWRGVSLVRRPHPSPVLLAGTIPASGSLTYAWLVPELGLGASSRRLFLQAEFVDPSGQKTLSTPATLVLLDSAF